MLLPNLQMFRDLVLSTETLTDRGMIEIASSQVWTRFLFDLQVRQQFDRQRNRDDRQ